MIAEKFESNKRLKAEVNDDHLADKIYTPTKKLQNYRASLEV
jgi:hypothetical protein